MLVKGIMITILIVFILSLSGCWLVDRRPPSEKPYGFWSGVLDFYFFGLRLIIKIFRPVDLFADHHTGWYTFGFILAAVFSGIWSIIGGIAEISGS